MTLTDGLGTSYTVKRVDEMEVLGDKLGEKGSTLTSLNHRITQATKTFFANRDKLTAKRRSLEARINDVYRTVGCSFLWMAGTWHITETILRRIRAWENRMLRTLVGKGRRDGEHFFK